MALEALLADEDAWSVRRGAGPPRERPRRPAGRRRRRRLRPRRLLIVRESLAAPVVRRVAATNLRDWPVTPIGANAAGLRLNRHGTRSLSGKASRRHAAGVEGAWTMTVSPGVDRPAWPARPLRRLLRSSARSALCRPAHVERRRHARTPIADDQPAGDLYNEGLAYLNAGKLSDAVKSFDEVDRQHPYSE